MFTSFCNYLKSASLWTKGGAVVLKYMV